MGSAPDGQSNGPGFSGAEKGQWVLRFSVMQTTILLHYLEQHRLRINKGRFIRMCGDDLSFDSLTIMKAKKAEQVRDNTYLSGYIPKRGIKRSI